MLIVSVCVGGNCHLKGAYNVLNAFQQRAEKNSIAEDRLDIQAGYCTGRCCANVSVLVGAEGCEPVYYGVAPEEAEEFFDKYILPKLY
jgi:NADH:ubiquinone oxidoreductase subunit E